MEVEAVPGVDYRTNRAKGTSEISFSPILLTATFVIAA